MSAHADRVQPRPPAGLDHPREVDVCRDVLFAGPTVGTDTVHMVVVRPHGAVSAPRGWLRGQVPIIDRQNKPAREGRSRLFHPPVDSEIDLASIAIFKIEGFHPARHRQRRRLT